MNMGNEMVDARKVVRAIVCYVIEFDDWGMRLYYEDGKTDLFKLGLGVRAQLKEDFPPKDHGEWLTEFKKIAHDKDD